MASGKGLANSAVRARRGGRRSAVHEPLTGLALDRANYLLRLTRDQIQLRSQTGLISDATYEFYRIRWCRIHGQRNWGDANMGVFPASKWKPRIER